MATKSKKTEEVQDDTVEIFAAEFISLVKDGSFDGQLDKIDEAVTERISKHNDEKAAAEKKSAKSTTTSSTRTVPQPTRKSASVKPSFTPDVNGKYTIAEGAKNIGGKKVKFLRFRKDDDTKAVVEMLEDAPGAPKGKKMVVPVAALKKPVAAGRRVVKKRK
jgi:hypothetical protein